VTRSGQREDYRVVSAGIEFDDCGNLVSGSAQSGDEGEITALVGEEQQRLFLCAPRIVDEKDLFVGERVGRLPHGRVDVIACQTRIRLEQIGFGRAVTEFAKDEFDRNPPPADHRFAQHHSRIDFDPIVDCHVMSHRTGAPGRTRTCGIRLRRLSARLSYL
jgi:hypothetical protein